MNVASPPTWNEAVPPGTVLLGKYRIDSVLGKGGMGMVVEATHLQLGEKVAIKLLRPDVTADAEACQRFLREAQSAVKLKSEHVARVTDVGTLEGGSPYMVMEFLEGVDLDQMITSSGVVAPGLAVDFVLQACEALAEAHSLGIVHRDIKPANFFVTWRPDGGALVKVLDFGISKAPVGVDLALTRTQSVLGTPAYMSPEQMRSARNVDARTDLWSLGTVLYELIEGRRPFEAESFSEMCVKVAADAPEPMRTAGVPEGLQEVIFKCLEKDPAKRYQNVGEVAGALANFSREPAVAAASVERMRRILKRPRTRNEDQSSPGSWPTEYTPAPVKDTSGGGAVVQFPKNQTPAPSPSVPAVLAKRPTPPPIAPGAEIPDTEKMPVDPAMVAVAQEVESAPAPKRRVGVIVGSAVVVVGIAVVAVMLGTRSRASTSTSTSTNPAPSTSTSTSTSTPTSTGTAPVVAPAVAVDAGVAAVIAVDAAVAPVVVIDAAPVVETVEAVPVKKKVKKKKVKTGAVDDVFGSRE